MLSAVAARKQRAAASAVESEDVPVPSTSAAAASSSSESSSESSSDSSSDSDSGSDSDDSVSSEYMNSLLAAAKKNLSAKAQGKQRETESEDILMLGGDNDDKPMPRLNPGSTLPQPYFKIAKHRNKSSMLLNDPEVEKVKDIASASSIAATLPTPPELSKKTGLPLTKAEKKALKESTAGANWFDLPAPSAADLPRLAREVEAMRLRNALDPKRFYRKEDTKAGPLPKYFAIGHIVSTPSPFGGPSRDDLPRAARKRTIVDELMDDDEARTYAKRKFNDLQGVRGERGRGTFKRKFARREKKF